MSFKQFKDAINAQFLAMAEHNLFVTGIDKDRLWDTYLESFPEGTNPLFRERTEHDCNCCKQFIRAAGAVVAIIDGKMVSIWDVDVGGHYQVVADVLSDAVKMFPIQDAFLHYEKSVGTDRNFDTHDHSIAWEHFYFKLPKKFVNTRNIDTVLGDIRTNKDVFKRGMREVSVEATDTIIELIKQDSLYRGEEHLETVNLFRACKVYFDGLSLSPDNQDWYCWEQSIALKSAAKMRNTVIGTLLVDLSNNVPLEQAVASFESKVAPHNYKRPKALITQGMINKAQEKVEELGIEPSLYRRYAITNDITINNVLFADRSVKKSMGVFDELSDQVKVNTDKFDKVEEVSISDFVENILPTAKKLELLFENRHAGNLMSLIAPVNADSPNILKWDNNFSWTYKGEVADSIKERVKAAGGNVTGDLRFSIQWNELGDNNGDLDAHCHEPVRAGSHIFFENKGRRHRSSGMLDVDIVNPNGRVAVENIIWSDRRKMPKGDYVMAVHCYLSNGGRSGFSAQIEFDGVIHDFSYDKPLRNKETVKVATVNWDGQKFTLKPELNSSAMARTEWGISTQQFHTVRTMMNSPNHWDGQETGNKHWFFILENCVQDGQARGFYNEFLKPELIEHRKVFEVLGSKLKTPESDDQLSGLGFSSTQRNSVICRVTGSFTRAIKINF